MHHMGCEPVQQITVIRSPWAASQARAVGPVSPSSPPRDTSTVTIFSREASFHMQQTSGVSLSKNVFLPSLHSSNKGSLSTCYMPCTVLSPGKMGVDTIAKLHWSGAGLLVMGRGGDTNQTNRYIIQLHVVSRTTGKVSGVPLKAVAEF